MKTNEPGGQSNLHGAAFGRVPMTERVLSRLVLDGATRFGDRIFADLPGGTWRFSELPGVLAQVAGALRALGIGRGDAVAVLSENRIELVATLWAQGWHGGVGVPVNPGHRAATLAHVLNKSRANALVAHVDKLDDVERILSDLETVRTVIVVGAAEIPAWSRVRCVHWEDFIGDAPAVEPADVSFGDPFLMMFTSGTTGPSKGVVMSHHHHYCYSVPLVDNLGWGPQSHLYTPLPLYHTAAHNTILLPGLAAGAQVTIRDRFSASQFWPDVARTGATHALLIGAMGNILMREAPRSEERSHSLSSLWCVPPPNDRAGFCERFGVELLWQGYGMTEVYPNQLVPDHPEKPANCIGRSTDLFELEVVDGDDVPVPSDGVTVGEIAVRPRLPYSMMTEYFDDPAATAQAFRNLWFHTGDLASIDEDGYLLFWGRAKDAIRRRGENVSAFELEREILGHPAVGLAAAFGVPSELGEEDIKVDIVLAEGCTLEPQELLDFLADRVPQFMMPRYIQFRQNLPMTPSQRVEKYRLKVDGIAGADFDAGDGSKRRSPTVAAKVQLDSNGSPERG